MWYTGWANLDLLTQVYPNPRFVLFGMLALEGGVVYWIGAYLLNTTGTHKGIAVVMVGIDICFSLVGFFIEISNFNAQHQFINQLPAVPIIIAVDVALNVGVGWIVHLLPDNRSVTKEDFRPLVDTTRNLVSHFNGKKGEETSTRSR